MQSGEESKVKVPKRRHYLSRAHIKDNGVAVTTFSGAQSLAISRLFAPSPKKTRRTLLEMRHEFGFSRPMMAAHLSVAESTLKSWETGTRTPAVIARKFIWMFNLLAHGAIPQNLPLWKELHSCEGEH